MFQLSRLSPRDANACYLATGEMSEIGRILPFGERQKTTHSGLSHQVAIGRNLTSTSVSDWLNDGGASTAAVYSKGLLPVTFPLLKNGPLRRVLQSQGIENERSVARFYLEVDGV